MIFRFHARRLHFRRGETRSDLNSESIESVAAARLKLDLPQLAHCFSRSTRALPQTRVFYVAFPISSIRPLGLPIDVGRGPATPLKLARVPACSPLPVTALPSMSLVPSAPFASRTFNICLLRSAETLKSGKLKRGNQSQRVTKKQASPIVIRSSRSPIKTSLMLRVATNFLRTW